MRLCIDMGLPRYDEVSIHALLAECDQSSTGTTPPEQCFNPRTPCGVRQVPRTGETETTIVSIHALLAECDTIPCSIMSYNIVSIHALLAECDVRTMHGQTLATGFNPRTPCGVRRCTTKISGCSILSFNPRTPCGVRPLPTPAT